MEFTGERFTPECVREIRYEHVHRYALAAELVRDKAVLDAACGEGYGARILADSARSVTGVDISRDAIRHAADRYRADNLAFQVADCGALPFTEAQFDAVVSFETLEHLQAQEALLREFRRVLAPGGFLVISSPDRAIYTDRLQNRNPFHVRELYREEFEALLATQFPAVRLFGQRLGFHSLIWDVQVTGETGAADRYAVHREGDHGIDRVAGPGGDAVYFIAFCAAEAGFLPTIDAGLWLFDDTSESVYRHYHHEIRKNMQAGRVLEERDREIEALRAAHANAGPGRGRDRAPWWRQLFDRFRSGA